MADGPNLPYDVRQFLHEHITSVQQLEILRFLVRYRSKEWLAEALAARFRQSDASAARRLDALFDDGLVARSSTEPPRYQYRPASSALDHTVYAVVHHYNARPADVVAAICTQPNVKNWPGRRA